MTDQAESSCTSARPSLCPPLWSRGSTRPRRKDRRP